VDRIISIELFGQAYNFRADAQLLHAEKITDYVVEHIEKARASSNVPGKLDTVILAALNIANDYFEMKRCWDELLGDIDRRCTNLIENIDASA
jgi:cell division protein ZapA (FtsZ GTPase activity inhibitor)